MKVYFLKYISSLLLILSTSILAFEELGIEKPNIQLAKNYQQQNININNYWVSEKLDGIRGYWNGEQLLTKQGKVIITPHWFTQSWPKHPIDGELWIARNMFEETLSCVVKIIPEQACWEKIRFMIFDLPKSKKQFSQRIDQMKSIVKHVNNKYIQLINQYKLTSIAELEAQLNKVVAKNGEGLMLQKSQGYYTVGRTNNVLKVKKRHDAEAIVIAHIPGKGKYQGMLGSLKVKTNNNIIFHIGSGFTDEERKSPPAIGSTITFQYLSKTKNNIPRFTSFLRIRKVN